MGTHFIAHSLPDEMSRAIEKTSAGFWEEEEEEEEEGDTPPPSPPPPQPWWATGSKVGT